MKDFWKTYWQRIVSLALIFTFLFTMPCWINSGNKAGEDVNETLIRYSYELLGTEIKSSYPEYSWPEYQDYLKAIQVLHDSISVAKAKYVGYTGADLELAFTPEAKNYQRQFWPDMPDNYDCLSWTDKKFINAVEAAAGRLGYKVVGQHYHGDPAYTTMYYIDTKTGQKVTVADLMKNQKNTTSSATGNTSGSGNSSSGNNSSGVNSSGAQTNRSAKGSAGNSSAKSKNKGTNTSGQNNSSSTETEPEPTITALAADSKAKDMVIVKDGVPIWCNFYGKAGQYTGEDNNRRLSIGQHVTITGVTSNGFYQLYAAGNPGNDTFHIDGVTKDTKGATPYYIDINGMDPNDPFIVPLSEYKGSWIFTGIYQAATCKKDGWKEEKNDLTGQTRHTKIPKSPHHLTGYVEVKKPGLFISGRKEAVCIVCHKVVKTKKIPSKISSLFHKK